MYTIFFTKNIVMQLTFLKLLLTKQLFIFGPKKKLLKNDFYYTYSRSFNTYRYHMVMIFDQLFCAVVICAVTPPPEPIH